MRMHPFVLNIYFKVSIGKYRYTEAVFRVPSAPRSKARIAGFVRQQSIDHPVGAQEQ